MQVEQANKDLPATSYVRTVPPKEFDTEYESMYFESPEMADKFMHELRNGYCFKCGHTSNCKEFYRNFDNSSSTVHQKNQQQIESTETKSLEKQIKLKKVGKNDKLPPDIRW